LEDEMASLEEQLKSLHEEYVFWNLELGDYQMGLAMIQEQQAWLSAQLDPLKAKLGLTSDQYKLVSKEMTAIEGAFISLNYQVDEWIITEGEYISALEEVKIRYDNLIAADEAYIESLRKTHEFVDWFKAKFVWAWEYIDNFVDSKIEWLRQSLADLRQLLSNAVSLVDTSNEASNNVALSASRTTSSSTTRSSISWRRAYGWPVSQGRSYIVWERWPELFVPTQSGDIIPNNKLAGNSVSVTFWDINIYNERDEQSLMQKIQETITKAVTQQALWAV